MYVGTNLNIFVELVDIESQGLSDIDDILVKSQAIPTELTKAQDTATLIIV